MKLNSVIAVALCALALTLLSTAEARACGEYFYVVKDGQEIVVYSDLDPAASDQPRELFEAMAVKAELLAQRRATEQSDADRDAVPASPDTAAQAMPDAPQIQRGVWGW